MTLTELNELPAGEAVRLLLSCCGSREWVQRMLNQRPFKDNEALYDASDRTWLALREVDWLEGFAAHPRIGERTDSAVSQREQAGALSAADELKRALELGNAEYERRFGFTFIVFATGKSAQEMLEILRKRIDNDRDTELRSAAAEQMKITRLRLQRLVDA